MKGNTAKTGALLMGSKEGTTQDGFAAHLGTRLESAEACCSHRQAFVPKSHANAGSNCGRVAGGGTQLTGLWLPRAANPLCSVPSLQLIPRLCCCWDMVMVFLSSSALMSSFVRGWVMEDEAF